MRRYTESVNTRFEVSVVQMLDEILERSEFCRRNHFNRSDLIRHMVRNGIRAYQSGSQNQDESRARSSEAAQAGDK